MGRIELDGQVAVVTGAGGGLGRSHALQLAERGAAVVVNDLGGGGDGPSAEAVVDEITLAGGRAVAVDGSVSDGDDAERIVATAVERFGRIDVVVNNAGILRDRSFAKMDEAGFRAVLDVHLVGAFLVTSAAWPHLKEQGYGRIVNTTSPAGLFGNFGQANYSAAKAGLIGFTRTLAIEGQRAGILANVVAPLAATRMTEEILPGEVLDKLDPALVSPIVTYLASRDCTDTGQVFTAGAGFFGRAAMVQAEGVTLPGQPDADDVAEHWDAIGDLGQPHEFPEGAGAQSEWVVERGSS